jgi:hypothetical protein
MKYRLCGDTCYRRSGICPGQFSSESGELPDADTRSKIFIYIMPLQLGKAQVTSRLFFLTSSFTRNGIVSISTARIKKLQ